MERLISKMHDRITVQRRTVEADRYHNRRNAWADHFSCFAYAGTYVKDEETGILTRDERTVSFEVRWCSELEGITSTGFRILFRGDAYNIEGIDMMNYGKRSIRIKCRREDAHGADGKD